jgi:hypothetical protein
LIEKIESLENKQYEQGILIMETINFDAYADYEKDFEELINSGMIDHIFVNEVCLGYPEKVDKDNIKNTIYGICSLYMKDDKSEPFRYWCAWPDKGRSFDIEDLTKDRAEFLYGKLDKIYNIFVKTKIADALWCSKLLEKDNIKAAEIAVDGYYKIIDNLLTKGNLHQASEYLARVFNLASSMKNSKEYKELSSKIIKYADVKYTPNKDANELYFYTCLSKISLLNFSDKSTYEVYCKKTMDIMSQLRETNVNSPCLSKFYELAIKFAEKMELDIVSLRIEKARLFESQAKNAHIMIKREKLKQALSEYKKAGKKKEVARLESEIQCLGSPQFTVIKTDPIDIQKYVDAVVKCVSGKNFQEATMRFCLLFQFPKKEEVYSQITEQMKSNIRMMPPIQIFDKDGRVVHKYSSEEERKEFHAINYVTRYYYGLYYYTTIAPALDTINSEHSFSLNDISKLIKDSPFIPIGYENIFAKGIYYFLRGEIMEASHLLIPQIEESLRNLLKQHKETTNVINKDGSEESATNIANLLKKCVEREIFPADLAWILEIYLISKPINLRSYIAHGKIGDDVQNDINIKMLCYITQCASFFYNFDNLRV